MEESVKFIRHIESSIPECFPKNHVAVRAMNSYLKKGASTLESDCRSVYEKYKAHIDAGKTSWLSDNLVIIGTKTCGLYVSMLYHKTKDPIMYEMFVSYLESIGLGDCSTTESHTSTSSSETSEEGPLDIIRGVYRNVHPQIAEVVSKMELPPPDGVKLSSKTLKAKEADLAKVKGGIKTFEESIGK